MPTRGCARVDGCTNNGLRCSPVLTWFWMEPLWTTTTKIFRRFGYHMIFFFSYQSRFFPHHSNLKWFSTSEIECACLWIVSQWAKQQSQGSGVNWNTSDTTWRYEPSFSRFFFFTFSLNWWAKFWDTWACFSLRLTSATECHRWANKWQESRRGYDRVMGSWKQRVEQHM